MQESDVVMSPPASKKSIKAKIAIEAALKLDPDAKELYTQFYGKKV